MPIAFRCTRCRAKLHVPSRWGGTSVACPKCTTRVMVPGAAPGASTPFEQRSVERSLEALQAPVGGTFAAESFVIPEPTPHDDAVGSARHGQADLRLPRWTIYAAGLMLVAAAAIAFVAGVWWAR